MPRQMSRTHAARRGVVRSTPRSARVRVRVRVRVRARVRARARFRVRVRVRVRVQVSTAEPERDDGREGLEDLARRDRQVHVRHVAQAERERAQAADGQ